MSLERALLKTIEEYEKLISEGNTTPKAIQEIHQRMKPSRDIELTPDGEVRFYDIVHPNSKPIRNDHSSSQMSYKESDGRIRVNYIIEQGKITSVYLHIQDFFFPQSDENGVWWHGDEDMARDYGENETEYGFMHTLKAEQKGSFFPQEARDINLDELDKHSDDYFIALHEKEARKLKLFIWDAMLRDFAIRGVTVPRISLEKGDLTAFFKHINYDLLDEVYREET